MSVEVTPVTAITPPPVWAKSTKAQICGLAAEAYQEAGEDPELAESILLHRLRDDPALMVSILDNVIHTAIRMHMLYLRHRIKAQGNGGTEPRAAKDAELAAAKKKITKWYRMPLPGGKKLGDAIKSDLKEAAQMHRKQARGHNKSARLYERITIVLPNESSVVSSVLSEEEIDKIASKS